MRRNTARKRESDLMSKVKRFYSKTKARILRKQHISKVCTAIEYRNVGEVGNSSSCNATNANKMPVVELKQLEKDMCAGRVKKKRSVIIPAKMMGNDNNDTAEEGTVNLSQLLNLGAWEEFANLSTLMGM